MNFRSTQARLAAATVGAVVAGTLAFGAAPASAAASNGYVSGSGYTYDDWNDEGTVSTASHTKSNVSCLWQKILWAEGATESDGSTYDEADVDGVFGANTKYATKKLQSRWGLTADGIAGKKSFTKAGSKLTNSRYVNYDSNRVYILTYKGSKHSFPVYRGSSGKWSFYENNKLRLAGYDYRSCV